MNRKQLGSVAAAAAFALLASGIPLTAASAPKDGGVKCAGINSCKGHNDCKTAANACKGQGSCKGKGFIALPASTCSNIGGTAG